MIQAPVVQSTHRRAALTLAAGTSALAVLAVVVLATELRQQAYIMPVWVVVVAAICLVFTVIGGGAAVRRGRVAAWLAPPITSVLAVACLEVPLALPLALILLVLVTVRALRRVSGRIPDDRSVGAPGFLLTIGLVPLFLLIFLGRPVVECITGGGSSAVPVWAWFGNGNSTISGSFSGSSDSVSSGTESVGATTYSWVCDGSTVVRFATSR